MFRLFLAAFLVSAAVAGPLTTAPPSLPDPINSFVAPSFPGGGMRASLGEFDLRSELLSPSSAAQFGHVNLSPTETAQSRESYFYLLLTASLVLLAFRPTGPVLTGRP